MLWGCAVLAMVSAIGANLWRDRQGGAGTAAAVNDQTGDDGLAADEHQPLRHTHDVPAFSLIDQNEKPVTLESLKGKPFIANFIFTNCAGPCPTMTAKMSKLQKSVPAEVKLVSFSVDPARDRPAVLKEYANNFDADHSRWHFLTVANPAEAKSVYTLSNAMLLPAQPAADEQSTILHSEKFVLVDADGKIRAYYSSGDPKQLEQLKVDATELLAASGK